MAQNNSKIFDELAKFMSNAAGAAQSLRKEIDQMVQTQVERVMNNLNIVRREDFEVVRDMAEKARMENASLGARIAELEKKFGA
jgi:BMFP domain-containing protein YqiC